MGCPQGVLSNGLVVSYPALPSLVLDSFPSCASDSRRFFDDRLDLSDADRMFQRGVVLFTLIGIPTLRTVPDLFRFRGAAGIATGRK